MTKTIIKYIIFFLLIPVTIAAGIIIFNDRAYIWISLTVAALSCVPVFIMFEKKESSTQKLIIIAVMIALSVIGRFAFGFLPHFKPVTAVVVIVGLYLGKEAGFLCGSLSAVISNFFMGQGPWTPFQMFAWGFVGLVAGILAKYIVNKLIFQIIYAGLAGILYSLLLDIYTVLSFDGYFSISRYIAAITASFPVTLTYAVSNIIFILLLSKPIGDKINRLKVKYGI